MEISQEKLEFIKALAKLDGAEEFIVGMKAGFKIIDKDIEIPVKAIISSFDVALADIRKTRKEAEPFV